MRQISLALAFVFLAARAEEHGGGSGGEAKKEAAPVEAKHESAPEEIDPGLALKSAKQSSRDVKVPRSLVGRLEKEYREYLAHNQWPAQESLKRRLLNVAVELRQKRAVALHEEVRINTPTGGGVIDMADFVTPLRGAFQMQIKVRDDQGAAVEGLRVFYVSQAKERSVDGESLGSGCGKLMEITSFFTKKMARQGFELYTADQRYVSVLDGIFVLASFTKEALQVGSVSFFDSRFPNLSCD